MSLNGKLAAAVLGLGFAAVSPGFALSQTGTTEPPAETRPEGLSSVPGITVLPPLDANGRPMRPAKPANEADGDAPQGCPFQDNKLELIV